jgi:tRNA modifying enzyme MnmG/GidA C-terminal domain
LRRQQADLAVFASDEAIGISPEIDYERVQGLSNEIKERLKRIRPASIVSPSLPFPFECASVDCDMHRVPPRGWRV